MKGETKAWSALHGKKSEEVHFPNRLVNDEFDAQKERILQKFGPGSVTIERAYESYAKPTADGEQIPQMEHSTRAFVAMPCHYREPKILRTLALYAKQTGSEKRKVESVEFEIVILVNNGLEEVPPDFNWETSPAMMQIREAQQKYPELNIIPVCARYGDGLDFTVGGARRALQWITIQRALDSGVGKSHIKNMAFISHDADSVDMSPTYIADSVDQLDHDPEAGVLTSPYRFHNNEFVQDHLFLAVQRFQDFFEIIAAYKNLYATARGGNTVFRVQDLLRVGSIPDSPKRATIPPARALAAQGRMRFLTRVTNITSSARRQRAAKQTGMTQARRHEDFGTPEDRLLQRYLRPGEEVDMSSKGLKVSDDAFIGALSTELSEITRARLGACNCGVVSVRGKLQKQIVELEADEEGNHKEEIKALRKRIEEEETKAHAMIEERKQLLTRAAEFLGIKIEFTENNGVKVTDISKLKARIYESEIYYTD